MESWEWWAQIPCWPANKVHWYFSKLVDTGTFVNSVWSLSIRQNVLHQIITWSWRVFSSFHKQWKLKRHFTILTQILLLLIPPRLHFSQLRKTFAEVRTCPRLTNIKTVCPHKSLLSETLSQQPRGCAAKLHQTSGNVRFIWKVSWKRWDASESVRFEVWRWVQSACVLTITQPSASLKSGN